MDLLVATFPDRSTATDVLADIQDEDFDWGTDISSAAVAVTRNKHGKVKIHHAHESRNIGAVIGGVTGLLVGAIVAHPIVGTALGAAGGAAIGSAGDPNPVNDYGLDKKAIEEIGQFLEKNSSALFVAVPDPRVAAAADFLGTLVAGDILRANIDDAVVSNIEKEIQQEEKKAKKAQG